MDANSHHHQARRPESRQDDLAERIARAVPEDGTARPLDGLMLRRASAPTEMGHGTSYPSFCVIAQGSKEIRLGDRRYRYDPAHYLVASNALPIATRVVEASDEHPYLGFVLRLDPTLVGSVIVEAGHPEPRGDSAVAAIDVSPLDADLLDAVVRLVRLLDARPAYASSHHSSSGKSSTGSCRASRAAGSGTSRPWAARRTASPEPSPSSDGTSTSRCGSRISPGSSG